jgi:hypothetical protein
VFVRGDQKLKMTSSGSSHVVGVQIEMNRADLLTAESTNPAWHLAKIPRQLQVNERAI